MDAPIDWRASERRLFAAVALVFPIVVLIGFARTYYLRTVLGGPPVPSLLVHAHSALMTAWVAFFIAQVWLIRSKQVRLHMKLGMLGVALGIAMVIVGFFTGVAAAKFGSASTPPGIPPLVFLVVPIVDISLFALFFGGAILYRRRAADHKRLMLLTVLNFLPPAVGRFPLTAITNAGPLFFFGVPTLLAIGLLIYDTRTRGQVNRVFLVGSLVLIASYPLRLVISGTDGWLRFAAWLTTWAA